jgi:D-alanyl-D-alanine carboxypeptidase/D-alanyl-D-alanine carboxypeptidase (penicillin-binding protein 5/6)
MDMAKIAQYAMENEKFREIVRTKEMDWKGEGWETILFNHHRLLWDYEGTTGVKNGFVPEAGHTLVTSAERDGMELIAVTLKAASKYYSYWDTMSLLDYGFANFLTEEIEKGEMVTDAAGREYMLAKNIFVARQDQETIALKVNKAKDLVVKVGDRVHIKEDVLVEQEKSLLTPVPSAASSDLRGGSGLAGETEAKTSLASTVIIFLSLFAFIFIMGMFQKRRRRKKLQQRYSNPLGYPRRRR